MAKKEVRTNKRLRWTTRKISKLQNLIKDMVFLDFKVIFKYFPSHNESSIRYAIEKYRLITSHKWSVEEERILREKWREGWTAKQVAKVLPKRTPFAIIKQARVLGIKNSRRKQWSKERTELLISYSKIYTVAEIARTMRLGYMEVHSKLRTLGVPYRINRKITGLTEAQVKEIKKLLAETNLSQARIAAKYNVSKTTIYDIKYGHTWASIS